MSSISYICNKYWLFCLLTLIRAEELEYVLEARYSNSEDESDKEEVNDVKSGKLDKDTKDVKDAIDVEDYKRGSTAQQKKWIRDDPKCLAIIIRHLADYHIAYVRNANTSAGLQDI